MFDGQSTTEKIATNSSFPLATWLEKLCKATCFAKHCGSSDMVAVLVVAVLVVALLVVALLVNTGV